MIIAGFLSFFGLGCSKFLASTVGVALVQHRLGVAYKVGFEAWCRLLRGHQPLAGT